MHGSSDFHPVVRKNAEKFPENFYDPACLPDLAGAGEAVEEFSLAFIPTLESQEPGAPAPALLTRRRREIAFRWDDTTRLRKVLDACPTFPVPVPDNPLSIF